MNRRILITSALPYVNNIPHLGNLIQVLSADVFARFCRSRGHETLYVCGTDEYGTATETKALEEGVTPKELCDRYFKVHDEIYKWFEISFDRFGRTSTQWQTDIVQDIFKKADAAGYISEETIAQLYCASCDRFLADRYVQGTCPHCGYEEARGDQCENCGKLLEPTELVAARCGICGGAPVVRESNHLYLDLPEILPKLQKWMDRASVEGFWARNAIQMTKSWIRDGLHKRCITRDLKWGIPVPKEGYETKVFYVWFDAPIGYISITANHTEEWERWWKNPEEVRLFQFIGKDNIPFHTVIFPSSLIASGDNWTMLHHMSSTEYLNYESGKFSKSKGVGVFGTDVQETGIPADVWRFYIFYHRPEKSDAMFTWSDFQEKVNSELIGNLANLVNRTLTFAVRFYEGVIPEGRPDPDFVGEVKAREEEITELLERAELREAFRRIFALSSYGNKAFQAGEPWRTRKEDPEAAAGLIGRLVYLVRDLAIMVEPYIPQTSRQILDYLDSGGQRWESLASFTGIEKVKKPEILFQRIEDDLTQEFRDRFSGSQKDREEKKKVEEKKTEQTGAKDAGQEKAGPQQVSTQSAAEEKPVAERFAEKVDIRVAEITKVEQHPEADKLYVETINLGGGEERTIVSGLVPYYEVDELLGKRILLVYNLKPAKLRGIKSDGMLLAAEKEGEESRETIEVLHLPEVKPGTRLQVEGYDVPEEPPKKLKIDEFFALPLRVKGNRVMVGERPLLADGKPVLSFAIADGKVG
jgi:methionyl-tRNA synthetase